MILGVLDMSELCSLTRYSASTARIDRLKSPYPPLAHVYAYVCTLFLFCVSDAWALLLGLYGRYFYIVIVVPVNTV